MTTSQIPSFFAEVVDGAKPIPEEVYSYFREHLRNNLYDFIVRRFLEKEKRGELSRTTLARRLNKKKEQITRWLAGPTNWTLDTASDLVLAIHGGELGFSCVPIADMRPRNSSQIELLNTSPENGAVKYLRFSQEPSASSATSFSTTVRITVASGDNCNVA